jgi:putative flippase GtrA
MLKIISIGKRKKEIKRFARFLVVGLSGTILDFAILTALKMLVGMATLPANVISYSAGVINNFTLNRLWTFSEARDNQWYVQFWKFVLINVGAVALNSLIVLALEKPLGVLLHNPEQGYLPAKVVATGIVFFYNFMANRLWTFREVGRAA